MASDTNLAGRQGGQKTVNMTCLGLQSDNFNLSRFSGSSKACLFRRHHDEGFGLSKICPLDNFLTKFFGPKILCVLHVKCKTGSCIRVYGSGALAEPIRILHV